MYALQQVKNGQRTGKVWMFDNRKLAQESVIKTYQAPSADSIMDATFSIAPDFVQVNTNYMGTIYFSINEVIPSNEIIYLD